LNASATSPRQTKARAIWAEASRNRGNYRAQPQVAAAEAVLARQPNLVGLMVSQIKSGNTSGLPSRRGLPESPETGLEYSS
jgi:hypothetical protein